MFQRRKRRDDVGRRDVDDGVGDGSGTSNVAADDVYKVDDDDSVDRRGRGEALNVDDDVDEDYVDDGDDVVRDFFTNEVVTFDDDGAIVRSNIEEVDVDDVLPTSRAEDDALTRWLNMDPEVLEGIGQRLMDGTLDMMEYKSMIARGALHEAMEVMAHEPLSFGASLNLNEAVDDDDGDERRDDDGRRNAKWRRRRGRQGRQRRRDDDDDDDG